MKIHGRSYLIPACLYLRYAVQDHARKGDDDYSRERYQSVPGTQRRPGLRSYPPPAPVPVPTPCRARIELGICGRGLRRWTAPATSAAVTAALGTGHRSEVPAARQYNDDEQEVKEGEEAEREGAEHDEEAIQRRRNPQGVQYRLRVADLQSYPRRDGRQGGQRDAHAVDQPRELGGTNLEGEIYKKKKKRVEGRVRPNVSYRIVSARSWRIKTKGDLTRTQVGCVASRGKEGSSCAWRQARSEAGMTRCANTCVSHPNRNFYLRQRCLLDNSDRHAIES